MNKIIITFLIIALLTFNIKAESTEQILQKAEQNYTEAFANLIVASALSEFEKSLPNKKLTCLENFILTTNIYFDENNLNQEVIDKLLPEAKKTCKIEITQNELKSTITNITNKAKEFFSKEQTN